MSGPASRKNEGKGAIAVSSAQVDGDPWRVTVRMHQFELAVNA